MEGTIKRGTLEIRVVTLDEGMVLTRFIGKLIVPSPIPNRKIELSITNHQGGYYVVGISADLHLCHVALGAALAFRDVSGSAMLVDRVKEVCNAE
jgi:hypothetical protein